MDQVQIGDLVKVGAETYDYVYSLSHNSKNVPSQFLKIHITATDPIEISDDHMMFIASGDSVPVKLVKVGDSLQMGNGDVTFVTKIAKAGRRGAYAPFTMTGTIVVNAIVASSYVSMQASTNVMLGESFDTGLSMQTAAHLWQTPHRVMCRFAMDYCRESEICTGERISKWVDRTYQLAKYLLAQRWVAFGAGVAVWLLFVAILTSIESVVANPAIFWLHSQLLVSTGLKRRRIKSRCSLNETDFQVSNNYRLITLVIRRSRSRP